MRNSTQSMAEPAMVFKCFVVAAVVALFVTGCGAKAYESVGVGTASGTEKKSPPKAAEGSSDGSDVDTGKINEAEEQSGSAAEGSGDSADAVVPESVDRGAETTETDSGRVHDAGSSVGVTESVCVYVCGAVHVPGVYELPVDARIADAVSAAGGMTEEADGSAVNLSAYVVDEMQITIPVRRAEDADAASPVVVGAAGTVPETSAGGKAEGTSGAGKASDETAVKININTATADELITLNGIGESRAADIIAYREEHGAFAAIEDIMQVSGIKTAVFEKIRNDITV